MTELSPLAEIERLVQMRAKDRAFDLRQPDGVAALRALIDDEIAAWRSDYQRGGRPFDLTDPATVADRAFRNLAGYGPLEPLLADDDVWEVCVNAPDAIFVKRHRGHSGYHDEVFHDDEHVLRTLTKLLDDAGGAHRKLDASEGLQDAQLDDGARLHIVHGDVGRGGHVLVNIRKFTGVPFKSLDELVDRDMLDTGAATFLRAAVQARQSIVFAGPPGSGKTTMLSCCAAELDPSLRVVVAEEVFEVPFPTLRACRPDHRAPTATQLTCKNSSPGSSAWPPTSPLSEKSGSLKHSPNFALTVARPPTSRNAAAGEQRSRVLCVHSVAARPDLRDPEPSIWRVLTGRTLSRWRRLCGSGLSLTRT